MARYRPGDIIVTSVPFAFALNSDELGKRCDFCFCSSDVSSTLSVSNLKRCSNCKLSFYCSTKCQRNAWGSFHKDECSKLAKFNRESCPTETFIFFARLAYKVFKRNGLKVTEDVCNSSRSFEDLESHVDEIAKDQKRLKEYEALECFLSSFSPELTFERDQLLLMFGKMVINTYTICDAETRPIGTGLYLGASVFDHSCDPNSVAVYSGTKLYVRAIKDITSHQDIFVNYVDPIDPTAERQEQLRQRYYFNCSCPCCLNTDVNKMKTEIVGKQQCVEFLSTASKFIKEVSAKRKHLDEKEKRYFLDQCILNLNLMKNVLGSGHILKIRMLDLAFDLCVDLNLWSECLEFVLTSINYYKLYYNKYYPIVGVQLFKLGKIQNLLGQLQEAIDNFAQARKVLSVCYGTDHKIVQELEFLLSQCQTEISNTKL